MFCEYCWLRATPLAAWNIAWFTGWPRREEKTFGLCSEGVWWFWMKVFRYSRNRSPSYTTLRSLDSSTTTMAGTVRMRFEERTILRMFGWSIQRSLMNGSTEMFFCFSASSACTHVGENLLQIITVFTLILLYDPERKV